MLCTAPSGRLYAARRTWICDHPACGTVEREEGREGAFADLPGGWSRTRDGRHACSPRCRQRLEPRDQSARVVERPQAA
jgi:hypothetical protein